MKKELFIYGAGGLGREILSLINASGEWTVAGFIDDSVSKGRIVAGVTVVGGKEFLSAGRNEVNLILAFGDPIMKSEIQKSLKERAIVYPTIIHPSAILQDRARIHVGEGTIIMAGCVLTTDIQIGHHALINLNTTIGHDVHIGNFSSVMPGVNVAGEVIIGDCVLIGSGANIMNRMVVSDRSRVGMGAVVTKPVEPGITVVGVPAKRLRS